MSSCLKRWFLCEEGVWVSWANEEVEGELACWKRGGVVAGKEDWGEEVGEEPVCSQKDVVAEEEEVNGSSVVDLEVRVGLMNVVVAV